MALIPYLIAMLGPFAVEVTVAFLSMTLMEEYDCSQGTVGIVFSLSALMYVVGAIIGPIIFKETPPKILTSASCFVSMMAAFITGPATFLTIKHDFNLVLGGMVVMALSANLLVQVCLPEVIDHFLVKYKIVPGADVELDGKLYDM